MSLGDETDRLVRQQRIDAEIARASACHMSDAKWRRLFAGLRELDVGPLRWKFVRDDRVFVGPVPAAGAILERTLGDVFPYPFGPYREIDWIEVPNDRSAGLIEALAGAGQFPIRQHDSGVRVVGYSWKWTPTSRPMARRRALTPRGPTTSWRSGCNGGRAARRRDGPW